MAIRHRTVEANGISMHVAESGAEGDPAVVFLHGFPELWYSWRHQMAHLAARGYRCVAPDLRGYGGTAAPPDVASYSAFHVVGDVVALLDALGIQKVLPDLTLTILTPPCGNSEADNEPPQLSFYSIYKPAVVFFKIDMFLLII
jgi:pimeloyl-ACP methyl ester carboxylesterase